MIIEPKKIPLWEEVRRGHIGHRGARITSRGNILENSRILLYPYSEVILDIMKEFNLQKIGTKAILKCIYEPFPEEPISFMGVKRRLDGEYLAYYGRPEYAEYAFHVSGKKWGLFQFIDFFGERQIFGAIQGRIAGYCGKRKEDWDRMQSLRGAA